MPKNKKEEIIYLTIGVILMITVMTAFNKYRVMHEFSPAFFKEVGLGFLLRLPIVWPTQYFWVQPYAGKKAAELARGKMDYMLWRIRYTVLLTCPYMSLYSIVLVAIPQHWGFAQFMNSWISGMCVNAVFAFFIQFYLINWLNGALFRLVCPQKDSTPAPAKQE